MKLKSVLVTVAGLSLAAVLFAQTSTSGSGQSSSSSSGSKSSSAHGSSSASGGSSARGGQSGSGSGFGMMLGGKPTHAIQYTIDSSISSAEDRLKAFNAHTKYLGEQQMKGKVLLFGPWRDLPGSMAIIVALSDEEANEIARNDPAVRSGSLTFEVRAWQVVAPATGSPNSGSSQSSGSRNSSSKSSGGR